MKKACLMLLICASVVGFLACSNNKEAEQPAQPEQSVQGEAVAQMMTAVNELKAKYDAAETEEEKGKIMDELSMKLQDVLAKDPNNAEANALMDEVQLYYAGMWARQGKYSKALEIVDNVLQFSPDNQAAKDAKAQYEDWEYMTREEFDKIKKGMYMDEVTQLVGYPLRKTEDKDKYGRKVYGWFYKEPELNQAVSIWFDTNGQVWNRVWPKAKK